MDATVVARFQTLLGDDPDAALRVLRDAGASKVESIKLLVESGRFDASEAKCAVHESPVWADVRSRDDDFADLLRREID